MVLLNSTRAPAEEARDYVAANITPTLNQALVILGRERPADPLTRLAELLIKLKPPKEPAPPPASKIQLIHFNDVYNCETPKNGKKGGAPRFISAIKEAREPNSVTFFSGDAFNPSIMSTVVRGGQLPLVLNASGVQCAVVGNHDFDFGPERMAELLAACDFPWLCSNVMKANADHKYEKYDPLVAGLQEFTVLTVGRRKLGCIGLCEEDWLETLFGIPRSAIAYEDYKSAAKRLASMLRSPPYSCDAVLALTHMRQPNDDALAAACAELGVDVVLAGHDHHYGVTQVGGTCIFKSGTDFETFTTIDLEFGKGGSGEMEVDGAGSGGACGVAITGYKRVDVTPEMTEDEKMVATLAPFVAQVDAMLGATLCDNVQALDCRRDCLRLMEAPAGNLVADVMMAATGAQVCLINGGTLRAERVIEAGAFTMRELFEILPMMETVAVIKVTGAVLQKALENSVSKYPKKDGRFAQVAGVSFVFDPDLPAGSRTSAITVGGKPMDPAEQYTLCSKEFLCIDGKDGYDCFVGCPILADGEAHPALPTFVQRHLAAIGKRGEPLKVEAEGRILLAKDAANAPAPPPALPTAATTPDATAAASPAMPVPLKRAQTSKGSMVLLGAAGKMKASAARARLALIARDVYGHDQGDPLAGAAPMERITR